MRLVTGDAHTLRTLNIYLAYIAQEAARRQVEELILNGDNSDITRDPNGIEEKAALIGESVGRPLAEAGIPCLYVWGNHEGNVEQCHQLRQALTRPGRFDPLLLNFTAGPVMRGPWSIMHGHEFDPWCRKGSVLTPVGEALTRLDHLADQAHLDLEAFNPANWHGEDEVLALDWATHRVANRWAARYRQHLVYNHTHAAYTLRGDGWAVINTGSCRDRVEYAWITDRGEGGLLNN